MKLPRKGKSLEDTRPDLALQFDEAKNGIKTHMVFPKSGKKYWWTCKEGHSWQATPGNRCRQPIPAECPACNRTTASPEYSLATAMPKVASAWSSKNSFSTEQVLPFSHKDAWFICEKGHEFSARIADVTSGRKWCSICTGRQLHTSNSLAALEPLIASEWDFERNGGLSPEDVTVGSDLAVFWRCRAGHSWKAKIYNRTNSENRTGCPLCSQQTSLPEIRVRCELETVFRNVKSRVKVMGLEADIFLPDFHIAIEIDGHRWHRNPERDQVKNVTWSREGYSVLRVREHPLSKLLPQDVIFKKRKLSKGTMDEILENLATLVPREALPQQKIKEYLEGNSFQGGSEFTKLMQFRKNAPREKSIIVTHPEVASQWHPAKNGELEPDMVSYGSGRQVWWLCKCGFEWKTSILNRCKLRGTGCPSCAGKIVGKNSSLADQFPSIASQWVGNDKGNSASEVLPFSNRKATWRCHCGHQWEQAICARTISRLARCPNCRRPAKQD